MAFEGPHQPEKAKNKRFVDLGVHQARWERQAEDDVRGTWLRKPKTAEDFMRAEADRDNADFDRRASAEYQKWHAGLEKVISRIEQKRDLPTGETEDIRPMLIIQGGGQGAVYAAGQLLGIETVGIHAALFKQIITISGGGGTGALYVAGQTNRAASICINEGTSKEFLDRRRGKKMIDMDVIMDALREGPKAFDTERVLASPVELYAIAKDIRTGLPEIINVKTAGPDMIAAIDASSAIPPFREPVRVNDEEYIDGSYAALPLEEIIERFRPTDVLILPNRPFESMDTLKYNPVERVAAWTSTELNKKMGGVGVMATVESLVTSKERSRAFLESVEGVLGVNIGVMWPPDSGVVVMGKGNNPDRMRAAAIESARSAIAEFGGEQPERIELFEGDYNENDRVDSPKQH